VAQKGNAIKARPSWWMWVLPGVAGCALGLWLMPQASSDRQVFTATEAAVPIGTTGQQVSARSKDHVSVAGYEADPQPSVVREIETITGANDGMALVGRRVDLHVDVQERATDVAFWVGPRDNRVLVVLARDNRSARQRKQGEPAGHRIAPVHGGQRAVIAGVIRQASAEDLDSWNLNDDDKAELDERKIYIRADAVASEGHGHF
jgi:hypothetical protein